MTDGSPSVDGHGTRDRDAPALPRIEAWQLLQSPPGLWLEPAAIAPDAEWLAAVVPGTVGAALQAIGRWRPDDGVAFDAFDFWYRAAIEGDGPAVLRLAGLATLAEVYVDGRQVLASSNMFLAHEIHLTLAGRHILHIAFRSLDAYLATRKGRPRWRPKLVRPPSLRFVRTLLLGHIPGWGPPVHAVGPYRTVELLDARPLRIVERRIATHIDREGDGLLDLAIQFSAAVEGWVTARCGTIDFALVNDGDDVFRGRAEIPDLERWWPHTHGNPALYAVTVFAAGRSYDLGKVGFRTVEIDRDADGKGFGLAINGEPVFCRGACWTTADIVALPFSRQAYLPILTLAREAGMNMIRVGGTMGYEGDAFYALCDELGLLVWQDFAFSNFDYPAADPAFCEQVAAEAAQFLVRTQGSPCLAVLCGASEVAQQAAMLGMPPALWSNPIFDDILPAQATALRPDVPYTPHSPWGGDLPFVANEGISHYYGVSAHLRSVEEARRAQVRFSAESLGFANVPDVAAFTLEPDSPEIVHRNDIDRVPHEVGASWAFEGVRNHYAAQLYGVDVAALRRDDPERFLALARATSAEVMEATFAEWRRAGAPTRGALVWFLRDVFEGAGWGVIDARNAPKAAYYGLKRAFRPVSIVLTDENLNGLAITLINETAQAFATKISLTCLRDGAIVVMHAETDVVIAPRGVVPLTATALWGGFFDTTYAFRFGAPSHDTTFARLTDAVSGEMIAEAFHFPLGRRHACHDLGLSVSLERTPTDGWRLELSTRRLAQSVRIIAEGYRAADNYFHLAPAATRHVALEAVDTSRDRPTGQVDAVNGSAAIAF